MTEQAPTVDMPPWPWEDARFVEPPGMAMAEWVAWAREAYRDYPDFLQRLIHPAMPHTFEVEP